jgi:hypothetical protein
LPTASTTWKRRPNLPDLDHSQRIGLAPSWGAKPFPKGQREGFVTLASGKDGDDQSLRIRADARLVAANLKAGETAEYHLERTPRVPGAGNRPD